MGCVTSRPKTTDTELVLVGNTDFICAGLNTPKEPPSWMEREDYDKLVAICTPLGDRVWWGNRAIFGSPMADPPPIGEEVAAKLKTELPKHDVEVKPNWFRAGKNMHYEFIVTVKNPKK